MRRLAAFVLLACLAVGLVSMVWLLPEPSRIAPATDKAAEVPPAAPRLRWARTTEGPLLELLYTVTVPVQETRAFQSRVNGIDVTREVVVTVPRHVSELGLVSRDELRGVRVDGSVVGPEELDRELTSPTPVLVCDPGPVDTRYLQMFAPRTLVLSVVGRPTGTPPPVPGGGPVSVNRPPFPVPRGILPQLGLARVEPGGVLHLRDGEGAGTRPSYATFGFESILKVPRPQYRAYSAKGAEFSTEELASRLKQEGGVLFTFGGIPADNDISPILTENAVLIVMTESLPERGVKVAHDPRPWDQPPKKLPAAVGVPPVPPSAADSPIPVAADLMKAIDSSAQKDQILEYLNNSSVPRQRRAEFLEQVRMQLMPAQK